MGDDLLPTDPAWYAYHFWTDPVGVLTIAKMGGSLGKMAHTLSDRTLLWSYAILRGLLCIVAFRHCALHTGGEPDRNHCQRANHGCLSAKQLLLCRLSHGGKYRGVEVPEPCA